MHRVANFQTLVWDLRLFVILQTFLLLFYICLKPRLFFAYPITKPPTRTQEFKSFDSILQKKFCDFRQKRTKLPPPSWLLLLLGRPMACGNAYVKHFAKFPDFFETQCWQPCLMLTKNLKRYVCDCMRNKYHCFSLTYYTVEIIISCWLVQNGKRNCSTGLTQKRICVALNIFFIDGKQNNVAIL